MPVVLDTPIVEVQKSLYVCECFKHVVVKRGACVGYGFTKNTIRISGFSMDQAFGYAVFV